MIAITDMAGGDQYRDGKVLLFSFASVIAAGYWVGKKFHALLGIAYAWIAIRWVLDGVPGYGQAIIFGIPSMLYLGILAEEVSWLSLFCLRVAAWVQVIFCCLETYDVTIFNATSPYFRFLITGSMGHPIVIGVFFAAMVPVALKHWTKVEALIFIVYTLYADSTCSTLGLIGAGLFYLYRCYGNWKIIALGAFVVAVCCFGAYAHPEIDFFSFSGRMVPWKRAWELIEVNPKGYGAGSWAGRYMEWKVPYFRVWDFLHNDWLQLLFEGGWVVFLCCLIASIHLIFTMDIWAACSLVVILIDALGAFPFHLAAINFLCCAILSLGKRSKDAAIHNSKS